MLILHAICDAVDRTFSLPPSLSLSLSPPLSLFRQQEFYIWLRDAKSVEPETQPKFALDEFWATYVTAVSWLGLGLGLGRVASSSWQQGICMHLSVLGQREPIKKRRARGKGRLFILARPLLFDYF